MHILASGEIGDTLALVRQYGPMLVMVVFFLYRDFIREDRLMKRIEKLEDEQRKVILPLVTRCTEVIAQNTEVMDVVKNKLRVA